MSSALKLEPRWPEPARLTATSALARHMSASSARRSRRRLRRLPGHGRTPPWESISRIAMLAPGTVADEVAVAQAHCASTNTPAATKSTKAGVTGKA